MKRILICLIVLTLTMSLISCDFTGSNNESIDSSSNKSSETSEQIALSDDNTDKDTLSEEVEAPLLTLSSIEEYEKFIDKVRLPADFLFYEDIKEIGEFECLVIKSYYDTGEYNKVFYTLRDSEGNRLSLNYAPYDSKEEEDTSIITSGINAENLRKLNNTQNGIYISNGIQYKYVSGLLLSVSWITGNYQITITGDSMLSDYPQDISGTFASALLAVETAKAEINTLDKKLNID